MPLHGRAQRPGIHAIGTDAHRPAAAARAEGQNLVEAVEQSRPLLALDEPCQLRAVRGKFLVREPLSEEAEGLLFDLLVDLHALETLSRPVQQVHHRASHRYVRKTRPTSRPIWG